MHNLKTYESHLSQLPSSEYILDGQKRVNVIHASDIFKSFQAQNLPVNEITKTIEYLISQRVLVKADINNKKCSINLSKRFDPQASYIFVHEKTNWINILIAFVVVILILGMFMHQLWPRRVRHYSSYLFYLVIGFLCFIMVLGVVRLVVFGVTFFMHPPGIWLFPNLFADVGFVESFIPLWCYHGENVQSKKEKSD